MIISWYDDDDDVIRVKCVEQKRFNNDDNDEYGNRFTYTIVEYLSSSHQWSMSRFNGEDDYN